MRIKSRNSYTIEEDEEELFIVQQSAKFDLVLDLRSKDIMEKLNLLKKEYPNGRKPYESLKPSLATIPQDLIDGLEVMDFFLLIEEDFVQTFIVENEILRREVADECVEIHIENIFQYADIEKETYNTLSALGLYTPKKGKQL